MLCTSKDMCIAGQRQLASCLQAHGLCSQTCSPAIKHAVVELTHGRLPLGCSLVCWTQCLHWLLKMKHSECGMTSFLLLKVPVSKYLLCSLKVGIHLLVLCVLFTCGMTCRLWSQRLVTRRTTLAQMVCHQVRWCVTWYTCKSCNQCNV